MTRLEIFAAKAFCLVIFVGALLGLSGVVKAPEITTEPTYFAPSEQIAAATYDLDPLEDILLSPEPSKNAELCYMGDEMGYIHPSLDENWICDRCGEYIAPRYGFTDDDIYLLAQLLCGDASISGDGEYDIDFAVEVNHLEVSKVLCVVMNQVRDERFQDTVSEVVLSPGRFIVFPRNKDAVPSEEALQVVREWCDAYDRWDPGAQSIPEDHIFFTGDGYTNTTRA